MRKPSVLLVGQGPPTKGGIPTFVTSLLKSKWLHDRVSLELMNTTPPGAKRPGAFDVFNVRYTLLHAYRLFTKSRRVDVVHLNLAAAPTLPLVRAMVLSLAAKVGGATVILHAHTGLVAASAENRLYRSLLRITLHLVDTFIVVSDSAEQALRKWPQHVVRLENGIDPTEFRMGPKVEVPPSLVFVGTVSERKGLLDLRDALVSLSQDHGSKLPVGVLIVGDGEQEGPGAFERIHASFAEAGLSEVHFCGAVDRDQLPGLLARASIFCLPSHSEGFPLSLLEGMAAGAAPIASAVGDIPRILDHGRCGLLIDARDHRALADAIERLAENPDEREQLGQAARRRVEQDYNFDRVVRSLYATYVNLASQSIRGHGDSG